MSGDYTLSGTMYQGIYVILFSLDEENDLFITHSKSNPVQEIQEVSHKGTYKK